MKRAPERVVGFNFFDVHVVGLERVNIIVGFKAHHVFGDKQRALTSFVKQTVVVVKNAENCVAAAINDFAHIFFGFDEILLPVEITKQLCTGSA